MPIRLSLAGKTVAALFAAAVTGSAATGGAIAYFGDTEPPADNMQSLVSDLSAVVTAEAERRAIDAGKTAAIEKLCGEIQTQLTQIMNSAQTGITVTVPILPPSTHFQNSHCPIMLDNRITIVVDEPDAIENESNRQYLIKKIMENLSTEQINKLNTALPRVLGSMKP